MWFKFNYCVEIGDARPIIILYKSINDVAHSTIDHGTLPVLKKKKADIKGKAVKYIIILINQCQW